MFKINSQIECKFICGMKKNLKTYHHVMRALFAFAQLVSITYLYLRYLSSDNFELVHEIPPYF